MVTIQVSELVDGRTGDDTTEYHLIRYFQRETLAKALEAAGMELLRFGRFPEYRLEPDIQQWSAFGVARAAGSLLP